MDEDGKSDHYKVRSVGGDCRYQATIPNKSMITELAQDTRKRSGKGGTWMIRKSDGGNGKTSRVVKRHYMKVAEGRRKGIPVEKKEPSVTEPAGTSREVRVLAYVQSEIFVSLLSISVGSMDMLYYCEIHDIAKRRSEIGRPSVTHSEGLMRQSREENTGGKGNGS